MANNVNLTIQVDDKGSLNIVAAEADKAAKATDRVTKSTDRASNSRSRYNKLEKGTAQLGANSTKNFAKQAQTIGSGLVPAYATLAANLFALSAAFGALKSAAAVVQLEQGLIRVGQAAGQNLPFVADHLKDITGHAISSKEAMEATALAMSAGFSTDQLFELTKVAKGASLALGRDMGDALTRLTRGTAKLEPEILDELGIIVRLDEATRNYAITNSKAVDSLTRYERQQAFLNATIEEGRKKFDIVAESVDPNPYDQLSASLADLAKTGLTLLNDFLIPVVSFLAESPVALTGALAMFGSTIISQIIPALDTVIAQQARIAVTASKTAKQAAVVISAEYTKIQAKVKSLDFSISPKSVKAMEAGFKAGTISVKEMNVAVRNLSMSEKLRNNQPMGKQTAEYQAQTAAIVQQRLAIEALIAAESKKYTAGAGAVAAKAGATSAGLTARGLTEMDRAGGIMQQFSVAAQYSGLQMANVSKKGTGLVGTFKALGGAAKLFGRALLNAIPIVGQIVFVASLLEPLLGDLFKKGAVAAEADKVRDSFDKIPEITTKLQDSLEKLSTAEEKHVAILKVRAGLMDQLAMGMQKLISVAEEEHMEELIESREKQIRYEEWLAHIRKNMPHSISDIIMYEAKLADQQEKHQELMKRGVVLSVEEAKNTIKKQIAMMELMDTTGYYATDIDNLTTLLTEMGDSGEITAKKLEEMTKNATKDTIQLHAETAAVTDGFVELNKEVSKSAQKAKGQGAAFVDALGNISNSIKAVDKLSKKQKIPAVYKISNDDHTMLFRMNMFLKAGVGYWDDLQTRVDKIRAKYQELITTEIKQLEVSKQLNETAKRLGEISSKNGALKEAELRLAKESIEAEILSLEAKQKRVLAEANGNKEAEEYKKVTAQIGTLENKLGETSEDNLRVRKAQLLEGQRLQGITDKILKSERVLLDIKTKQARRALELRRYQTASEMSAEDELALLREKVKAETTPDESGKSMRDKEEAAAIARVNMEFDLLELQFDLEAARLARLKVEKPQLAKEIKAGEKAIKAAKEAISGARTAGVGAVTGKFKDKVSAESAKEATLEAQAAREKRERELEYQSILTEGAKARGDSELAFMIEQKSKKMEMLQLEKELGEIQGNSAADEVARANKKLEILRKEQELATAERAKRKADMDEAMKNAGPMLKHFMQTSFNREEREKHLASLQEKLKVVEKEFGEMSDEANKVRKEIEDAQMADKKARLNELSGTFHALSEQFKQLGPEGEIMSAISEAAGNMVSSFKYAFETIKSDSAGTAEKIGAVANVVLTMINSIMKIQQAQSKARIRQYDKEIEAEKKRDGKSAESVAKLKGLEAKKQAEGRKAFEQQKKMQMAQAMISTAIGALQAFNSAAWMMFPANVIVGSLLAAAVVAMGAKQMSIISSQSYDGGGSGGGGGTPSTIAVGKRTSSVDLAKSQGASGEQGYLRGEAGVGGSGNFKPRSRFSGGDATAGAGIIVGEQGPELFVPQVPGRVVSNDEVASPVQNVNFSIQAVDASGIEDILVNQRGNIIGMLREASNSYGEPFMEKVNTQIYSSEVGVSRYGA